MTTEEAVKSSEGSSNRTPAKRWRRLGAFVVDLVIMVVVGGGAAVGLDELHVLEIRNTYNNQTFNEVRDERSDLQTEADQLNEEIDDLEAENKRLEEQLTDPTAEPPPGRVVYLDSLAFVTGALKEATFAFGTDTFEHSFTRDLSYCNDPRSVEWLLPSSAGTFDVELGVDPASSRRDAEVSFQIFVDDSPIEETTLGVGGRESVSAAVQGGERLRFEASLIKGTDTACGPGATAVWGSPRITIE